jgi:hypothetical protein
MTAGMSDSAPGNTAARTAHTTAGEKPWPKVRKAGA